MNTASYLPNIKQIVVIHWACSEWVAIAAGVPQGSILGPLLFLIYIHIIKDIHSRMRLFADGTSLYLIVDETFVAAPQFDSEYGLNDHRLVRFNPARSY